MPTASTTAPPAVAVDSATGQAAQFARADHTHQSRLQARRIQLTFSAAGLADYTFPLPYDAGVIPTVEVTAETPPGATYKLDACVVQDSTTNLKTTIAVAKVNRDLVSGLVGALLPVFTAASGKIWVHVMTRAPS